MSEHQHRIEHWPSSGTGYGVCECGATVRVEQGKAIRDWHACDLCCAPKINSPKKLESSKGD